MNNKLNIFDPITDKMYEFFLNDDDFQRAHEDMNFGQNLLNSSISGGLDEAAKNRQSGVEERLDIEEDVEEQEHKQSDGQKSDIEDSTSEAKQKEKHIWGYNETIALINSVETHIDDLNHPVKRRHVFSNVANDLISLGCAVNAELCSTKWKTLLRSYKVAKDGKTRTGRGPSRFHFFDLIDNILGDKPSIKCHHTMESGDLKENVPSTSSSYEEETPEPKKRRINEKCLQLKNIQEKKEVCHKEKMAIERKRLEIEEKKVQLLEKFLENQKKST